MSKTFFTADTHFYHGNIIKYCNRPFLSPDDQKFLDSLGGDWKNDDENNPHRLSKESIKMMDDNLLDKINEMVGEDDTLIHLGDFAFGGKKSYFEVCKAYRERIRCKNIIMIWGNHDRPKEIYSLFKENNHFLETHVNGQFMVLCHYAMAIWNKSHHGAWHLYGHSHATAEPWLNSVMPNRRSIDIGVDNAKKILGEYRPFAFDELKKIMDQQYGHIIDHH